MTKEQFKEASGILEKIDEIDACIYRLGNFILMQGNKGVEAEILLPIKESYCQKGKEALSSKRQELWDEFSKI